MADDWQLYYYPVWSGRAGFIRLVFEEAGVKYREVQDDIRPLIIEGKLGGYPHFAPPMVKNGSMEISQTSVVCRYLGEKFGLYPDTDIDRLHAEQVNVSIHDFIGEGRLAFHGIQPVGPYLSQKEATQPYIDRFIAERLPRWLSYFERVIKENNGGKGFLYGNKLCYADLALFYVLKATEYQFPEAYKNNSSIPLLKAFVSRVAARPRIAEFYKSDRFREFSGDSMM